MLSRKEGWTFDPFGGEIRDGKIFGRGSMDDKGPTMAALYAMAALRDSGSPLKTPDPDPLRNKRGDRKQ